jgi:hypothetical protein
MMTPSYSRAVIAHREVIAKLRLLRAAAILKSTGKMPDLADPFGADLLMSESEGAVRIWSLGTDGVNQNGIGSWSTYPAGRGEDLVLELSR